MPRGEEESDYILAKPLTTEQTETAVGAAGQERVLVAGWGEVEWLRVKEGCSPRPSSSSVLSSFHAAKLAALQGCRLEDQNADVRAKVLG